MAHFRKNQEIGIEILRYWAKRDFKGWDPYDMLNSKLIGAIVPRRSHFILWVCIQLGKVLPINLRRIMMVPKKHNAKGIALFISGIANYWYINESLRPEMKSYLDRLLTILKDIKPIEIDAWGYDFLWVARGGLTFPSGAPNVVVSYYVYSAIEKVTELDDYEPPFNLKNWVFSDALLPVLKRTEYSQGPLFSYSGHAGNEGVYNASLFGSLIFSKSIQRHSEIDANFVKRSVKTVENSVSDDGSIVYGQNTFQDWIDNHHTLYIIEGALRINSETELSFNEDRIKDLIAFYEERFLDDIKFPLFLNKKYVMDFHALGQLFRMTEFDIFPQEKVDALYEYWMRFYRNRRFPYRVFKYGFMNRINYVRWTQAFMFYGLSYYYRYGKRKGSTQRD